MIDINHLIKDNKLKIIVNPNSNKTQIIGFDEKKNALKVNIAKAPEDNKANIELIKFLGKITKRKVRIRMGLASKDKLVEFS